ncbi:CobW family GTP-binding protein [Paenibacillus sp. 1A_MP2]|uniref:CobW family GTP-binding protein n=1 Tax=Paenibacillus sp. 1A_MP2 TaxID=3457495 RepID=UPI003FCE8F39
MRAVPILVLSGFLGSGKTTFLSQILKECNKKGINPAVIMNEVGEVNLDGQMVEEVVPMREMLNGCICCTIRGDLSMELMNLIEEEAPDLVIIESTGVGNPIEILDAITETAMGTAIEIRAYITIVDARDFLHRFGKKKGRTYRLMRDQIRCASVLLLNKSDLVSIEELNQIKEEVAALNPVAPIIPTVQSISSQLDWNLFLESSHNTSMLPYAANVQEEQCIHNHNNHEDGHNHAHHLHDDHHSYEHLMVHTHYFPCSLDKVSFRQMFKMLPDNIYRAKGIFTDTESGKRMMFQYAFKELELFPIQPKGKVQDVAVFIGEHFPKEDITRKLEWIVSTSLKLNTKV